MMGTIYQITCQSIYKQSFKSEIVTNSNVTSYKHDWNNITDEKIIKYKQLLDYNFENFVIPQNIIECTNFQCKTHNNLILDLIENFMSVISDCSDKAIGVKYIGHLHKSGTMFISRSFLAIPNQKSIVIVCL